MFLNSFCLGFWRYMRKKLTARFITGGCLITTVTMVYFWPTKLVGTREFLPQNGSSDTRYNFYTEYFYQKPQTPQNVIPDISSTFFNLTEIHIQQMDRIHHIQEACRQYSDDETFGISSKNFAFGRMEIDREKNYLYCPLLKAGSTFFRRLFMTMKESRHAKNPFSISIDRALRAKRDVLNEILPLTLPSTAAFLQNATTILFVREPFSRLLSGYIDKLFAPNPYFWSEIGKHIIANFRPVKISRSLRCGHDVTFEEFIRYVINTEVTKSKFRDAHFTPSYDQCKPCFINYTIVGKMESFQADIAYTLSQLGTNISKENLSQWAEDSISDAIADSTVSPFGWRTSIKKCMTWYEALVRIWRKLQIRGIILFEQKFPWQPDFSERYLTLQTFIKMVKELHASADKDKLKKQKLEVLTEAYSQVTPIDLQKLVEVFRLDFHLFQYNPKPFYIFDETFVQPYRNRNLIFNLSSA